MVTVGKEVLPYLPYDGRTQGPADPGGSSQTAELDSDHKPAAFLWPGPQAQPCRSAGEWVGGSPTSFLLSPLWISGLGAWLQPATGGLRPSLAIPGWPPWGRGESERLTVPGALGRHGGRWGEEALENQPPAGPQRYCHLRIHGLLTFLHWSGSLGQELRGPRGGVQGCLQEKAQGCLGEGLRCVQERVQGCLG